MILAWCHNYDIMWRGLNTKEVQLPDKSRKGISHRVVHIWLALIIVIFSSTVVYFTFRMFATVTRINAASRQSSELQKAAHELMNASDYLTEQVQRFTINGDLRFMEQYFTEAFESKRREEALSIMKTDSRANAAYAQLKTAMDNSVKLMDLEYYAMRLVIEAKGYSDYPDLLDNVKLSDEDAALSDDDKIRRATELVLGDEYYELKDRIRSAMQACLAEVEKLGSGIVMSELHFLDRELIIIRISVLIQAAMIFSMLWLTTRLAINPVVNAVGQIKSNLPIPETGSSEFRYLAHAYNKMYEKNKTSLENLNFKASHDELTGAYNRAGYDFLLTSIDLASCYMMLFDVDNFKTINDTYGHDTGDKILQKLVNTLRSIFRDDDCICRIGGDEFVVFMVHSGSMSQRLVESKIEQINIELANTDDGLPPVSISVGIVNGKDVTDTSKLFEMSDAAMYRSKKSGKSTYTFYSE